jgi:hypothetical protein
VIGAAGKRSMLYFWPKLLNRLRCLAVPCNVNVAQECAISMGRIRSSSNRSISPDVQISSHPRTSLAVHDSQMKGIRVMSMWGLGVLEDKFSSNQSGSEGFFNLYTIMVVLIFTWQERGSIQLIPNLPKQTKMGLIPRSDVSFTTHANVQLGPKPTVALVFWKIGPFHRHC